MAIIREMAGEQEEGELEVVVEAVRRLQQEATSNTEELEMEQEVEAKKTVSFCGTEDLECGEERFRRLDGACNNLERPKVLGSQLFSDCS